jgi:hypothetical protein
MITPLNLVSKCRTLSNLADQEKFEEVVTLAQTLMEETYQLLDDVTTQEVKFVIDTIMIYGFLQCSGGIHEQIELIHAIIDPIIIKNMFLTNRFNKYITNPSQDIGTLYDLPDLALETIRKSLVATM